MDPKERIQLLSEELARHQHLYYVQAEPLISDTRYDALFDELLMLEQQFPQFKLPNSPTARVGSDLDQTFPQKMHKLPVLSLDKANSTSQISTWIEKHLGSSPNAEFIMEDKIDGLSIVLYYQLGLLESALTRGDGERGNDITENVKTIRQIPLRVSQKEDFIVRGEIYLEKEAFHRLNKDQIQQYANPRNLASGSIRLSHSSQVARIPLKFAAHDIVFSRQHNQTHVENLIRLKTMGFPLINPIWLITNHPHTEYPALSELKSTTPQETPAILNAIRTDRQKRAYEIDGMVFKINQHGLREQLGTTSHHPRWAIAFKFDAPTAETRLVSISIQLGRNGRITPVANLEPVPISGSVVSRATLHNQLIIDTLQIGPGDLVTISKRGDIIPAVEEVIKKTETNPTVYRLPTTCPFCQQPLTQNGAHLFCTNRTCPERLKKQLVFFAAKAQMDIATLGEQTLRQLFDLGYIQTVIDLYHFDFNTLLDHPGFGSKKIDNIKKSIENSKKKPFSSLLAALGIDGLGIQTIRLLVDAGYNSIDKLLSLHADNQMDQLSVIPGIGPALISSLTEFLSDPDHQKTIQALRDAGLKMEELNVQNTDETGIFAQQTWVITGTFRHFQPREKAARKILELGGRIGLSVSPKTTHLLVGENGGSKIEKAQKLGIPLIDEETFLQMISSSSSEISSPQPQYSRGS